MKYLLKLTVPAAFALLLVAGCTKDSDKMDDGMMHKDHMMKDDAMKDDMSDRSMSSDRDGMSMNKQMDGQMDRDMKASTANMQPYTDYKTVDAGGMTYVVANSDMAGKIKSGQTPPKSMCVTKTSKDGKKVCFVDSGAVTAGDLMAGYMQKNPDAMMK